MIFRGLLLALGGWLVCAADYPPPPAVLEPYIADGQLDPGDYGWIKGRFADATPEEKAAFQAIEAWTSQCRETALAELRTQLRAQGHAEPMLDRVYAGPLLCQQAMFYPQLADSGSFAAFRQELAVARPVVDAYLSAAVYAAEVGEEFGAPRDRVFERQALARRLGDQTLRAVLAGRVRLESWRLTPVQVAIFRARIEVATFTRDNQNTAWLKAYVAEHGWPTISAVGAEASNTAWLVVQHADADPLFQLQALGLMEPLVAAGEVSRQNYAFLYDRTMLKLAGKQRYGTQARCLDGRMQPQPLEDEAAVNRRRQEVGLNTVEAYLEGMAETSGTACQAASRRS